ncbi:MAG: GMC family oxidoreductase N-terminal domain-containing protein [Desulfomonilia bacterium]|jgi:choline dehydrogenase-like flavoprotein
MYEYIVIGTGPGGAPVARELAEAGKKVLMLERGAYHTRFLGFPFGVRLLDRFMIGARSMEGVIIERGITVGGSSMVYQSNVSDPPRKLIQAMGIDFRPETDEMKRQIGIKVLPERFYSFCKGTVRVLEAAEKMGLAFKPQEKFIDPDRCRMGCDWCMLGCPENARWTTREYVDDALAYGAELRTRSRVEKIVFSENRSRVLGVRLTDGTVIRGENVILSAGGIGSPALLKRSGIKRLGDQEVGTRFFMDPMNVILGYSKDANGGMWGVPTFSHAIEETAESEGFIIGNASALGTWIVMTGFRMNTFFENWYRAPIMRRGVGLFVKMSDEPHGTIHANEKTEKPFLEIDHKRVNKGTEISREILIRANCIPSSISVLKWAGGHPGGTIAMGKAVNRDFTTEIQGLYVCDGSLMPVSPGAPPSLSICGMSRLLGKTLTGKVRIEDRFVEAQGKPQRTAKARAGKKADASR